MRASDSSAGADAGQFHSTRWTAVVGSLRGPSKPVSLAFREVLIAADGRLTP
jgi:hypothetical protein